MANAWPSDGSVGKLLSWLHFGARTLDAEAVGDDEAPWSVYVEAVEPLEAPATTKKLAPLQRVPLREAPKGLQDQIAFVEHADAGIIWGRLFHPSINKRLLAAYLCSSWARSGPAAPLAPPASLLPDACWHLVADFAPRAAAPLQLALGTAVDWAPWLRRALEAPPLERPDATVREFQAGARRAFCAACFTWANAEELRRCSECNEYVCGRGSFPACSRGCRHECGSLPLACRAVDPSPPQEGPQELVGPLVAAAAGCAAVAQALQALPRPGGSTAPAHAPERGASVCGLAERLGKEGGSSSPFRRIACEADVLAARYSEGLLAVRMDRKLRVVRRGDWKTVVSMPAHPPGPGQRVGLEVLEDSSSLVVTTARGLEAVDFSASGTNAPPARRSVPSDAGEWSLQALERGGLLAACTAGAMLRDLGQPALPVVAEWQCRVLGLSASGAVVDREDGVGGQGLALLDARQRALAGVQLPDLQSSVGGTFWWEAAAVRPGGKLLALGASTGELVGLDLRRSDQLLWSLRPPMHGAGPPAAVRGPVIGIQAAEDMFWAETFLGQDSLPAVQAVTWRGTPLALFAGVHCLAGPSPGRPPALLACGVGQSLVVAGVAPQTAKTAASPAVLSGERSSTNGGAAAGVPRGRLGGRIARADRSGNQRRR